MSYELKFNPVGLRNCPSWSFSFDPQWSWFSNENRTHIICLGNARVQIWSASGTWLKTFSYNKALSPVGVDVDVNNNIIVVDQLASWIHIFDSGGQPLRSFGSHGSEFGCFDQPWGVTTDRNANILIADQGTHIPPNPTPSSGLGLRGRIRFTSQWLNQSLARISLSLAFIFCDSFVRDFYLILSTLPPFQLYNSKMCWLVDR